MTEFQPYRNMFASILTSVGNSRTSLYFLIISAVLNIGMDLFFIVVLNMGVAGTALATVIAQTVSAVLCGMYVIKNYQSILPKGKDFRVSREMLSEPFSDGFAMALMLCVVDLGSVIFQRANNALNELIISAHTASRRIIGIMMQLLATIATASSTFVGQNWGAKKTKRIQSALYCQTAARICSSAQFHALRHKPAFAYYTHPASMPVL